MFGWVMRGRRPAERPDSRIWVTLASVPARSTVRAKPAVVNGAPRLRGEHEG